MRNPINIMEDAIDEFGEEEQIIVAIEELSELQKELCKYLRDDGDEEHLNEEMADVSIIMDELELIFANSEDVKLERINKLSRLDERMKCHKRRRMEEDRIPW